MIPRWQMLLEILLSGIDGSIFMAKTKEPDLAIKPYLKEDGGCSRRNPLRVGIGW